MRNQLTFKTTIVAALILLTLAGCDLKTEEECVAEMIAELDALQKMQDDRLYSKNEDVKILEDEWWRSKLAISNAKLTVSGLAIDKHRDACDYYVFGTSIRRKDP